MSIPVSLCKHLGPESGFREMLLGQFYLVAPLTTPVVPPKDDTQDDVVYRESIGLGVCFVEQVEMDILNCFLHR